MPVSTTQTPPLHIVLSTVGEDQSGLVAALTQAIRQSGGNIEDSCMTRLGGQFSMMFLLSLESVAAYTALKQALVGLEASLGIAYHCKSITEAEALGTACKEGQQPYILTVAGQDRTGITEAVSTTLASFKANITDLNAHRMMGEEGLVYIMVIEFDLPISTAMADAELALKQLGQQLGLDVRLRRVETAVL